PFLALLGQAPLGAEELPDRGIARDEAHGGRSKGQPEGVPGKREGPRPQDARRRLTVRAQHEMGDARKNAQKVRPGPVGWLRRHGSPRATGAAKGAPVT